MKGDEEKFYSAFKIVVTLVLGVQQKQKKKR